MITEQTAEAIAKAAYNGHDPEGYCDLIDYHLHTCLSQLYADFKSGRITKSEAEARKKILCAAWASDKKTFQSWEQTTAEYNDNIRKISGINPESAKTPMECVGILSEMVAALIGDSSLPARLKSKFEG